MKYLLVVLIPLFFTGCNFVYMPDYKPRPSLSLRNLMWTSDGSKVLALADSTGSDGINIRKIRIYDKTGTSLQSYTIPSIYYGSYSYGENSIWPSNDDSTYYYTGYGGAYGDYILNRYVFTSGTASTIAGGIIYAESADRNHFFIGPSYNQSFLTNFLVVDLKGNTPRLQRNWSEQISQYPNAVWFGNQSIGYFRYNDLNLIDFIIRDTSGAKLDSFNITGTMTGKRTYYSPGIIYFVGYGGITKIDSASKANSSLSDEYIRNSDISADGSFLTYVTFSEIFSFNLRTGASKKLGDHTGQSMKISPSNDMLAYIDESNSSFDKLIIIPVSAP